MNTIRLMLLTVVCFVATLAPARAQMVCGPNGCFPVQTPAQAYYLWKPVPGCNQSALYLGALQVGGFNHDTGEYKRFLGNGSWSGPERPPVEPPAGSSGSAGTLGELPPGGVLVQNLSKPGTQTNWVGDRPVHTGPGTKVPVPDYSQTNFLSIIISDPGERERARAEAKASNLEKTFQLNIWGPQDWQVSTHKLDRDEKFKQTGRVAIVQAPSVKAQVPGQSLRAIYVWSDSRDLEAQLEGLGGRKGNEPYDPNLVPSPGVMVGGGLGLLLLIGAGLYGLSLKKQTEPETPAPVQDPVLTF